MAVCKHYQSGLLQDTLRDGHTSQNSSATSYSCSNRFSGAGSIDDETTFFGSSSESSVLSHPEQNHCSLDSAVNNQNVCCTMDYQSSSGLPTQLSLSSMQIQQTTPDAYVDCSNSFSNTVNTPSSVQYDTYCQNIAHTAPLQSQLCSEKLHEIDQKNIASRCAGGSESGYLPFNSKSMQYRILRSYINYKSSQASSGGQGKSQVPFVKYIHSTICKGRICLCRLCISLVSHFDSCNLSGCYLCYPVRVFKVEGSKKTNWTLDVEEHSCLRSGTSEDMLSLKRQKIENKCSIESAGSHSSMDSEVTEMKADVSTIQDHESFKKRKAISYTNDCPYSKRFSSSSDEFTLSCKPEEIDHKRIVEMSDEVVSKNVPVFHEGIVHQHEKTEMQMHFTDKLTEAMPVSRIESIAPTVNSQSEMKTQKQKIHGVSLTEYFTPDQLREHMRSLQQSKWIEKGVLKEKGENTMASRSEDYCQLCGVDKKITFPPVPIYCALCGARIKRTYYCSSDGKEAHHSFCLLCYKESRGGSVKINGAAISKSKLMKRGNNEEHEEPWVQCDRCEGWQHQICALFNDKIDLEGRAKYICPKCYLKDVETGKHKPLALTAFAAKDLPRSKLSDHIEQRLFGRLKQERQARANMEKKNIEEVIGAENLVVRVVSSVNKQLKMGERFLSIFHGRNYPPEFPYRSKVILMFQKIEGVDVCIFGMHVQEFGSECPQPNQRCVYISYLDSVKYFRPEIKTATGEALRTFVYHEVLLGYLDYCKSRGFAACHIWACPPIKGEDYILYCHPESQKTPRPEKLRQWYKSLLRKATEEKTIVGFTNIYDQLFLPSEGCNVKVTAARLPHFDGDYWSNIAEDMLWTLEKDSGEELQKKVNKLVSRRYLKTIRQTDQTDDAAKDILLMLKLGQKIVSAKEDFFVVHLQSVCMYCHNVIPTSSQCHCNQCKKYQLCGRCHDTGQRLEKINTYHFSSKQKQSLSKATEDNDINFENPLFDSRQVFKTFCHTNNYLFDTLRRAKHSSMMLLYHFHNPRMPFLGATSPNYNMVDQGRQCEISSKPSVCDSFCQGKNAADYHMREMTSNSSMENYAQVAKKIEGRREQLGRELLKVAQHASQCYAPLSHPCAYPNCMNLKKLFHHATKCNTHIAGGCQLCKKAWVIIDLHSKNCHRPISDCHFPRCMDLKLYRGSR